MVTAILSLPKPLRRRVTQDWRWNAGSRYWPSGFVFQQLQLLPYLTAQENVLLSLAIARRPKAEKLALAREALARVGLQGKEDRLPYQLSGGEQGRVAVARAIVNQPPLLLADEPTGNLDRATGEQVLAFREGLEAALILYHTQQPEQGRFPFIFALFI